MPADLRTIRDVELVKAGRWEISTGPWTVTPALLTAAAEAHASGTIPRPIVKLGHVDSRFDGEPALGAIDNIRTADGGSTLVGDLVGVPAWLADIAASAFPRRSVEGVHDLVLSDGTTHAFALTAVALLGVTRPGISTLSDIQSLYGVAASAGTAVTLTESVAPLHEPTARQRVLVRAAAARRRQRTATAILSTLENL